MTAPLVVGFDLDLTLIDSRPGISATFRALTAQTGVYVDGDLVVTRLGPPLEIELGRWVSEDRVAELAEIFRTLYPAHAVTTSPLLPGVTEALAAVRANDGSVIVITGKYEPNARLHLDHLGLVADDVVGWAWAEAKSAALTRHGAQVYVGDHPADMTSAAAAGVLGVGVTTGGWSVAELTEAGAHVVLTDLTEFPDWLATADLPRK